MRLVDLFSLLVSLLLQSREGLKSLEESGIFTELGESLALAESVRIVTIIDVELIR